MTKPIVQIPDEMSDYVERITRIRVGIENPSVSVDVPPPIELALFLTDGLDLTRGEDDEPKPKPAKFSDGLSSLIGY